MPRMQQESTMTAVGFKRIMVATDLGRVSERAVEYALALSKSFGATLDVVNVYDPSTIENYDEVMLSMTPAEKKREYEERLEELQRRFQGSGVTARTFSEEGHNVASTLLGVARSHCIDLLVAGTQCKRGFERMVLGSIAERLIREAECPVLTVGPRVESPASGPLTFHRIVLATDFSAESEGAASCAVSLAEASEAHLCICHVQLPVTKDEDGSSGREATMNALKALIPASSYDWCHPEFVVEHGDATEKILQIAEEQAADLIVMGAKPPVFWLAGREPKLSAAVLAQAKCPVLTCTEKSR